MGRKLEYGTYVVGGILGILGLVMYARRKTAYPYFIGSFGLLAAGGFQSAQRARSRTLNGAGLGLTEVSTFKRGGKTQRLWHDDSMGLQERVALLQDLVRKSVHDPDSRRLALAITGKGTRTFKVGDETVTVKGADCPARDDKCELRAIYDWVYNNIRYTGDVGPHVLTPGGEAEAVDFFATLRRAIETRGEDCDGHSVATATLAILNGFHARFRITSNEGDSWDHIYTMAGIPKLNPTKWVAMDTTIGPDKFNRQPKFAKHVDFDA